MALTPGQRLDLKKKLAGTLGQQPWRDIDLTLEEFGFPTTDGDFSDTTEYVQEMLRYGGSDESLAQLDDYLHPTATAPAVVQPQPFDDASSPWSGQGFRLFVSHVSDYAAHAGRLRTELAKRSIDAFVAHDSIEPTDEWQEVIRHALRSCDACLAFLTPGFKDSNWTDQEIGFCMARDLLVIPVQYGLTPYGFLGRYQAQPVKTGQDETHIALGVFELLVRKLQSRDAMARALVDRWATTASWDAARENYSFLRKIPDEVWTQQLVNEAWEARDRIHDLRTASINWKPSDQALDDLFSKLSFSRSSPVALDDDRH